MAVRVAALLFAGTVGAATAATLRVTTTADLATAPVPGICSLRAAVRAINTQTPSPGCPNTSPQSFGVNDRIRFASGAATFVITAPQNPFGDVTLRITRPVEIVGNGSGATRLSGGGGAHVLIETSSTVTLRDLALVRAGTGLVNTDRGDVIVRSVRVSHHQRRGIVNRGRMAIVDASVFLNRGGGIANANPVTVATFGGGAGGASAVPGEDCPDCPPPDQGAPAGGSGSQGSVAAALSIERSRILFNGPAACAGIVNGGGLAAPASSSGIGGSPVAPPQKLEGGVVVLDSLVSGNSAGDADGGGVCNFSVARIDRSLVARNRARRGAGLAVPGFALTELFVAPTSTVVVNSTLSGNLARDDGGGVFVGSVRPGSVRISFATIARNRAGSDGNGAGGGLAGAVSHDVDLRFSVVAGNRAGSAASAVADDCHGVTIVGNRNVIGAVTAGACVANGTDNLVGAPAQPVDAQLDGLGDNGGPTATHRPQAASVAVDVIAPAAAACAGNPRDQRGVARPRDGNGDGATACDVGAVER